MVISHKAAVQGLKDVWLQFGKAMLSVAGIMLLFALGAFAFKTWILFSWPQTSGTVVDSFLTMKKSGDGTIGCAAVESVQYYVNGQSLVLQYGGHGLTQDCAAIEARLPALRGSSLKIAYNKQMPEATYPNPGFNTEFYRDAYILGRVSFLAAIIGLASIQRHRAKLKREAKYAGSTN